ncbi:VOC family protein [Tessaracoccus sp. OS52]|uniref:VOC family protein n=1 Tax=Tessaracoccus sp. OS52 TaxID=2886691 RepID=UPI001D0FD370|nr:VOC family protein [Tessaracoccus sp. OS52]MCC2592056.1 VOC family protein [Tessaracoccus sp. OS52]
MNGSSSNPVRQLRLVVRADDFEESLRFFREVLGMPELEAYEGEGDARVVILDAGRATLELANPAQVELIDRVETDGAQSPKLRVALEVDDTPATTDQLVAEGAELVASPRETPWRSINSRLTTPGGLTVTLFQEPLD